MLSDGQWTFKETVLSCGDLRLPLAFSQPGGPRRQQFIEAAACDDLFRLEGQVLTYDMAAKERYQRFVFGALRTCGPLFGVPGRPAYPLEAMYTHKTCVIAGSHACLDADFVAGLRDRGAFVIAVGNAAQCLDSFDIWVGQHALSTYVPRAVAGLNWVSLVPADRLREELWDPDRVRFLKRCAGDHVRTYGYVKSTATVADFFEQPGMTDFDTNTSLGTAVATALLAGAVNIVFNGVALSVDGDQASCLDKTEPEPVLERKRAAYAAFRDRFGELRQTCREYGIVFYTAEDAGLGIPVVAKQMLLVGVERNEWTIRHVRDPHSLALLDQQKHRLTRSETAIRHKQLRAQDLFEQRAALVQAWPEVFDQRYSVSPRR